MNLKPTLLLLTLAAPTAALAQVPDEAAALSKFEARESHRPAFDPDAPSRFKATDHVFVQSALAIDFTYRKANVTLPLSRGLDSSGESIYYIVTDASDVGLLTKWASTTHPSCARPPALPAHRPQPSKMA